MGQVIEIFDKPLTPQDVLRRCNRLREGNEMSKHDFGKVRQVAFNRDKTMVQIATTKHTIYISRSCWDALGDPDVLSRAFA